MKTRGYEGEFEKNDEDEENREGKKDVDEDETEGRRM